MLLENSCKSIQALGKKIKSTCTQITKAAITRSSREWRIVLQKRKDWKYYTGMTFLLLSLFLPLIGFLIPLLDLPISITTVLMGALTVGGPEIMIALAVIFLGKTHILYLKSKVWKVFRKKRIPPPVSKGRYYFGLTVLLMSGLPLYLDAYFPGIMPKNEAFRYFLLVSADLTFVLSFFILGANFCEKFKRLFIWDGPTTSRQSLPSK